MRRMEDRIKDCQAQQTELGRPVLGAQDERERVSTKALTLHDRDGIPIMKRGQRVHLTYHDRRNTRKGGQVISSRRYWRMRWSSGPFSVMQQASRE